MPSKSHSDLPLAGIRILDLSLTLPGPYASFMLMQLGAEVTRVIPPWGDPAQEFLPALNWLHEGKRTLRLNLKEDEDRNVLLDEARSVDIVLEGFRPRVARRLGVDASNIAKVNQRVIYCSLSGYGQTGALELAPGHDANYQSLAGVADIWSYTNGLEIGVHPTVPLSDLAMSIFSIVAILAALRKRDHDGRGCYLDIAAADSIVTLLGPFIHARGFDQFLTRELPSYGAFQTSDDLWLTLGVIYEQHFWERLASALHLPEEWIAFNTEQRGDNLEMIRSLIALRIKGMSRDVCVKLLASADVPVMAIQTPRDVLFGSHFQERGVVKVEGERRDIGLPFSFQELPIEEVPEHDSPLHSTLR